MKTMKMEELISRHRAMRDIDWFDKDANTFFGTKLVTDAFVANGRGWFVTSEKPPSETRKFSVRYMDMETGAICSTRFCEFANRDAAEAQVLREIAARAGGVEC